MEKEINVQAQEPVEAVTAHTPYTTRPLWRTVCAWIGLILFLGALACGYIYLTKGGF